MSIATLNDIITKVRKLTGSGTTNQLTDAQIIDYIDSFYLYDFPAQFRSLKLKDRYTFNTQYGIDTYPFDSEHYTTVEMPCYVAKREVKLFQDIWSFYGVWFNWQFQETLTSGNGTNGTGIGGYSGLTTANPLIRSTRNNPRVQTNTVPTTNFLTNPQDTPFPQTNFGCVQNLLITANVSYGNTLIVTDDGAGNLIGDCTAGTINYFTGLVSGLIFNQAVPSGNAITIEYNPTNPQGLAIPQAVLFFQNQFTLRPVPDKGYTVELVAYRLPSQVLLGTDNPNSINYSGTPEQLEWWETLAFGAAKKIYEDRLDPDGVSLMDRSLMERYALNETRTYAQLGKQSMNTMFRDQLTQNYGGTGWGFGQQGT